MGKTVIAFLEWLVGFVSGGRIFVCLALAIAFYPLTLGIITFSVIVGAVWYGLHVHLAVGTVMTLAMLLVAYLNSKDEIPWVSLKYKKYHYVPDRDNTPGAQKSYKRTITKRNRYITYSFVGGFYAALLAPYIGIWVWHWENGKKYPLYTGDPYAYEGDDEEFRDVMLHISWVFPVYLGLAVVTLMTAVYFVSVFFFGSTGTIVSDFIHEPWRYLLAKFGL